MRVFFAICLCAIVVALQSCSTPAYVEVDLTAHELGLQRSIKQGIPFRHVVYQPEQVRSTDKLHVYIEGDGIAWRMRGFISSDPTPRNPLMLRLMASDSASTMYLGRPCYFGHAPDEECHPDFWTFSRFSEKVVISMARVIRQQSSQFASVVLIGHSGGGALAMLIAEHLPKVDAVVTVAGNLDVEGWVKHHKYTPLYNSLNPVSRPVLPARIRQLHLVGGRDEVVPPELVVDWISRQPSAERWTYDNYDHSCCWQKNWSDVLRWIDLAG